MKASRLSFALLTVLSSSGLAWGQTAGQAAKEPLTLELSSTIPGREVAFRLLAGRGRPYLTSGAMTIKGDTVLAMTPARLVLQPDSGNAHILLDVDAGEPWLHVTSVSTRWTTDAWGQHLEIRRANGHSTLFAPLMRGRPAIP